MILNYHDALTFVVRKNLHDGVDRASTHGGSEHDQFHVCILLEERERSDSSIRLLKAFALSRATEPPPTFPFLDSQCQRAGLWRELPSCQRRRTARKVEPNGRRGRGV